MKLKMTKRDVKSEIEHLTDLLRNHEISEIITGVSGSYKDDDFQRLVASLSSLLRRYQLALRSAREAHALPVNLPGHDPIGQDITAVAAALRSANESTTVLTSAFEKEKSKLLEQDWIKSKYSEIFDSIQGLNTVEKLGNMLAGKLAAALDAQQVVILTLDQRGDNAILTQVAGYGVKITNDAEKIMVGNGLLGQACADKATRYLEDVPQNTSRSNLFWAQSPRKL
jgi:hypothetical protein